MIATVTAAAIHQLRAPRRGVSNKFKTKIPNTIAPLRFSQTVTCCVKKPVSRIDPNTRCPT